MILEWVRNTEHNCCRCCYCCRSAVAVAATVAVAFVAVAATVAADVTTEHVVQCHLVRLNIRAQLSLPLRSTQTSEHDAQFRYVLLNTCSLYAPQHLHVVLLQYQQAIPFPNSSQ